MTDSSHLSGRTAARVAILDDDLAVLRAFARILRRAGHDVVATSDPEELLQRVERDEVDVVVSDLFMPGRDGLAVLGAVQDRAPVVPVILVSGAPTLDSAMRAFGHRAFALLQKPCEPPLLQRTVEDAIAEARERRERRQRRQQHEETQHERRRDVATFDASVDELFMVYQPIVRLSNRSVVGYEALVRSRHAELATPALLFRMAHRLGRENELARKIRSLVTEPFRELSEDVLLFLNVLASDLDDETCLDESSPLRPHTNRLVLEVSEQARATSSAQHLVRARELGTRIAIDDLGEGYASLNSVVELEPEVLKLDMVLVRHVHRHPVRQRLVRALVGAALELEIDVIAEGVETREELECLVDLGCDLFQGYFFARPDAALRGVDFSK